MKELSTYIYEKQNVADINVLAQLIYNKFTTFSYDKDFTNFIKGLKLPNNWSFTSKYNSCVKDWFINHRNDALAEDETEEWAVYLDAKNFILLVNCEYGDDEHETKEDIDLKSIDFNELSYELAETLLKKFDLDYCIDKIV